MSHDPPVHQTHLLEVSHQWEATRDGVWLALTHHLLCSLLKLLEGIWVQVAGFHLPYYSQNDASVSYHRDEDH